jgi:hypothetical protein
MLDRGLRRGGDRRGAHTVEARRGGTTRLSSALECEFGRKFPDGQVRFLVAASGSARHPGGYTTSFSDRDVSNPTLFYAIAGVSTSFAGFAGLYLALRPHGAAWERYEVVQVNTIILYGLTTLFGALLIVPLADLIGESLALRVLSAGLLVVVFYGHQVRSGTSWTRWPKVRQDLSRRALIMEMAPFVLVAIADQVILVANLVAPSEGLYQLALILILATPALVFVTVVSRFGSNAED